MSFGTSFALSRFDLDGWTTVMVVYLEPDKALACEIGISLALSNIDPNGGNNDMTDVVLALEVYSRAPGGL